MFQPVLLRSVVHCRPVSGRANLARPHGPRKLASSSIWSGALLAGALGLGGGCGGEAPGDLEPTEQVTASLNPGSAEVFQGYLASSGSSWTTHDVAVNSTGELTVRLDWDNPQADFNVFLYDPDGTRVAWANGTTERPETVTFEANRTGRWSVGIKAKTGAGNYMLTVSLGGEDCTVTDKLVHTCRPWLGGWANHYPVTGGMRAQIEDHERRIGRRLDVVHNYYPVGRVPLSTNTLHFLNRPDTLVFINWKPAESWRDGDGRSSTINARIDQAADSIKAVAPRKLLLTIHHEPENDVSGGTSCASTVGSTGTPAEYRAMWRNVRNRFDAKAVTNVVWVMNYMGSSRWDCMVREIWPGNDLVDWVMWDPYVRGGATFDSTIGRFYGVLTSNTSSSHAFTSKPWGLGEWGCWGNTQPECYQVYADAKRAVEQNHFPNLKALVMYDSRYHQISYSESTGEYDPVEEAAYRDYAQSPAFRD